MQPDAKIEEKIEKSKGKLRTSLSYLLVQQIDLFNAVGWKKLRKGLLWNSLFTSFYSEEGQGK